jgi:hypothetical protein
MRSMRASAIISRSFIGIMVFGTWPASECRSREFYERFQNAKEASTCPMNEY